MKGRIWEILWFVSIVIFIGAGGNIEISYGWPVDSVVLAILSFAYIIGFVMWQCGTSKYTKEDYNLMQIDLDDWCFGGKNGRKNRK